jgi:hypothetical protein
MKIISKIKPMKKIQTVTYLGSVIVLFSIIPLISTNAFGQQPKMGENVNEEIKVIIDENGTAHVTHMVQGNGNSKINVETIRGNITNISVTDLGNNAVQYMTIPQNPLGIMILPNDRNMTLIKYDLPKIVSFNDGVWKWDYFTPSDTTTTDFYFPSGIEQIWANDRPAYIGKNGIMEHGDNVKLEYAGEKTIVQNIQWENYTFPVAINSLSDVRNFTFNQPSMSFQFQIDKDNSFVTVIMPKSLLGAKYASHINGNHLLTTIFHDNGTHAWIGLRPSTNGTLLITGSTAIPEFPLFMPLVIAISLVVILRFRI